MVLSRSKSIGSDRLVLLVLASHADEKNFECYPGRDLLCRESAMSARNMIRCLNSLEAMGELTIDRGNGRGRMTTYRISLVESERVTSTTPFIEPERVTNPVERVTDTAERVTPEVKKGDKSGFACKEQPTLTKKKPRRNHVGATAPDPRTAHAAIQTCRTVTNRYPPKELWDKLISVLGDSPNATLLVECRTEWVERGYNRNSWKWATDWYLTGVPPRTTGNGTEPKKNPAAYVGKNNPREGKPMDVKDLAFMDDFVDTAIRAHDLAWLAKERDAILKRGGAVHAHEKRVLEFFETPIPGDEPATPEEMDYLNASIDALARR